MAGTWCPFAIRRLGLSWKVGSGRNRAEGAVYHSMVGGLVGAWARLDSDDRVSWHFSVAKDGRIYQHYPLESICWHAGSREQNERLIGIEHEGGPPDNPSEPLTEPQLQASARLSRWLMEQLSWPEFRVGVQALEHNWIYPTACPSGRIPWDRLRALVSGQEGEMDQELRDRMRVAAAFRMAAAMAEAGLDLRQLPPEQKQVLTFVLRSAGIV